MAQSNNKATHKEIKILVEAFDGLTVGEIADLSEQDVTDLLNEIAAQDTTKAKA